MAVVYRARTAANTIEARTECPGVYVLRLQHMGDTDIYFDYEQIIAAIGEIEQDYRDFGLDYRIEIDKLRNREEAVT